MDFSYPDVAELFHKIIRVLPMPGDDVFPGTVLII